MVGYSSVGRGGFHSVSFRLPFFGVPFDSFFDESLGEWVAGVEVIGECVGEWDPVDLVVCDVVAVWVVQPSIVARIGVMLGFAILDWGRLVGVYCECWLVWLWDW